MTWWSKIKIAKVVRYELAGRQSLYQSNDEIRKLLPFEGESFEWLHLSDPSVEISHTVVLQEGQLIASLYIAPQALLPDRDWVVGLFKRERLSAMHRKALLAGQAMIMQNNEGPLVCSCFKVGKKYHHQNHSRTKHHP